MNTKVNYIVANYIGPLRTYTHYQDLFNKDPLLFVNRHLDFIQTIHDPDQVFATFVFNDDIDQSIRKELDNLTSDKFEIVYRKNSGFSYGIWNDTIIRNLNNYDYFFLIEDDYIPTIGDFLTPFKNRCKGDVAFVCGLVEEASSQRFPGRVPPGQASFPFPSISNGLISGEACRDIYQKYNSVFNINNNSDYNSAYNNQIYFCKYFTDNGYKLVDILDEYSSPYNNATQRELKIYGGKKPPLLEPIIV